MFNGFLNDAMSFIFVARQVVKRKGLAPKDSP